MSPVPSNRKTQAPRHYGYENNRTDADATHAEGKQQYAHRFAYLRNCYYGVGVGRSPCAGESSEGAELAYVYVSEGVSHLKCHSHKYAENEENARGSVSEKRERVEPHARVVSLLRQFGPRKCERIKYKHAGYGSGKE